MQKRKIRKIQILIDQIKMIKLLNRSNLKLINAFQFNQLRRCQIECAINQLNEETINNSTNKDQIKKLDKIHNLIDKDLNTLTNNSINDLSNLTKGSTKDVINNLKVKLELEERKLLDKRKKDKKKIKKNILLLTPKKIKSLDKQAVRIMKYGKAMGLSEDRPFEEVCKIVNDYISNLKFGLNYFENSGIPVYGNNFNSMVWYRTLENKKANYKHLAAELFEKNIIYDFSYDSFMNQSEKNSLIYQLLVCLGLNNKSKLPFPLLFANLDANSYVFKKLNQFYFLNNRQPQMIKITDQSYLDLLPKEEIIYLSPHAEESLTEFKSNYHYVIGCFIDISFSKCLSIKKAQAEGVKCYKLPIDEFVKYSKARNKLLPLPIVHQILLDKKVNTEWQHTLECNLGSTRLDIDMQELDAFKSKYKNVKKHLY